jgi:ribonuclease HII
MTSKNDYASVIIIEDEDDNPITIKQQERRGSELIEAKTLRFSEKEEKERRVSELSEAKTLRFSDERTSSKLSEAKTLRFSEKEPLKHYFNEDINIIEIGIDEAGRGPMFGRVYAGLAILPKNDSFNHSLMKDSKKFHSKKKIEQAAEYIKQNAIAWAVEYEDEQTIDEINILQATQSAMHKCIKKVISQHSLDPHSLEIEKILLLVDGNYFKPYSMLNKTKTKLEFIKYQMIEGGDNKYTSIAAASILAKVERDKYIEQLCLENPELVERYGIDTNKGYGSKKHMEGIKQYGITKWHRKTFGICKEFV